VLPAELAAIQLLVLQVVPKCGLRRGAKVAQVLPLLGQLGSVVDAAHVINLGNPCVIFTTPHCSNLRKLQRRPSSAHTQKPARGG
jgi:hypothetical protein